VTLKSFTAETRVAEIVSASLRCALFFDSRAYADTPRSSKTSTWRR
jgi:hypothetical protein